jgi:hypothetical protein
MVWAGRWARGHGSMSNRKRRSHPLKHMLHEQPTHRVRYKDQRPVHNECRRCLAVIECGSTPQYSPSSIPTPNFPLPSHHLMT